MFGRQCLGFHSLLGGNGATMSGAMDIIVVRGPDGILRSTEWHVRFGSDKVCCPHQTRVAIHCHESKCIVPYSMKVGRYGEAYFDDEMLGYESKSLEEENRAANSGGEEINEATGLIAGGGGESTRQSQAASIAITAVAFTPSALDERLTATAYQASRLKKNVLTSRRYSTEFADMSLCGAALEFGPGTEEANRIVFEDHLISFQQLADQPAIWNNPALVFRFNGKPPYLPAPVAFPMIAQ
uniref:Lipin N-terminal domain-containing protein n=1 Tax=Chromera velia CCMP2878 TaxID=1169474 RepID=A0A0G4FDJ0_9ALVE|eukprot:Cvel_16353.t1-p1 / transcript=Cvel_16353.t1 / gene=Cvel_16353 / organism=Chromera_velia_CCMP2878 / gene_product=Phosphatidic acid phosphohydrolase 1, putative / transcript_product=Phosphatidic acid phosphohydrolase 1, putative / location=Cvel_scaffold1255:47577-51124(+) / protein_length=240 / sequence_SO=supercontig / SO=protein_coding / is_pseudo=false